VHSAYVILHVERSTGHTNSNSIRYLTVASPLGNHDSAKLIFGLWRSLMTDPKFQDDVQ